MTSTDIGEATEVSNTALTESDAAEALLSRWTDKDATAKELSEKVEETKEGEGDPEGDTTDPETSDPEEGDPEDKGEEEKPKKYADDDETYVKIKVGEDEHEVPVKELKRLFGQEAALTKRSQEVAEARKTADAETAKALTGLQAMVKRAQERAEPYKKIDFLVAAKELSAEELTYLRQEAQRALDDEKFLTGELDGFVKEIQTKQRTQTLEQAKACVKSLTDETSPHHIKGWGDKVYDEVRAFAVSEGIDQNTVNSLVDPAAIKLLHMAMQFKRGLSKTVTTKVNKTPKKIVKTSATVQPKKGDVAESKKAMAKLRESGKTDDAAEAFLARWKKDGDE